MLKRWLCCEVKKTKRPAAFRRLCVETRWIDGLDSQAFQPPSGGCVLKHTHLRPVNNSPRQPPSGGCVLKLHIHLPRNLRSQPPSGGCVLKRIRHTSNSADSCQPPSGGCVLKPPLCLSNSILSFPAAFRRLCVETGGHE